MKEEDGLQKKSENKTIIVDLIAHLESPEDRAFVIDQLKPQKFVGITKKVLSDEIDSLVNPTPEEKDFPKPDYRTDEYIIQLIASGQRSKATEEAVTMITADLHFYTTKNDKGAEVYVYHEGIYIPQGRTTIREGCRRIFGLAYTPHIANEVIAKIEADTYVDEETFLNQVDIYRVPVANGILNLKTKELEDFSHKKIFFGKLPVTYDKKATCEKIKTHFNTVLKHKEDVNVMQELIGFCLLDEYRYEKAFMFIGGGRNGKGKSIELIKRLLGVDNCASISLQQIESDTFAASELAHKKANLCGDLSRTALKETGMFKQLTGRDLINANRKHLTRIKFTNHAKMIYSCNELPNTSDTTVAFFNRWIIFDFPYTFVSSTEYHAAIREEKAYLRIADPSIIDSLTTDGELSGLLNWAVEGLDCLFDNTGFSYSKNTAEVKDMWLRKSDSFMAFCLDCLVEDFDGVISKSDIRRAYQRYCREHRLTRSSDKNIKYVLELQMGAGEERNRVDGVQVHSWSGISFKKGLSSESGKSGESPILPLGQTTSMVLGGKQVSSLTSLTQSEDLAFEEYVDVANPTISQKLENGMVIVLRRNGKNMPIEELQKWNSQISDSFLDDCKKKGLIYEPKPGVIALLE